MAGEKNDPETDSKLNAAQDQLDPVFVHSWRETVAILILFSIFLIWSVGVSFWMGWESRYVPVDGSPISTTLGMPSWVFYGVMLPWAVVNLVAIWFCFAFIEDDDLEVGSAVSSEIPQPTEEGAAT